MKGCEPACRWCLRRRLSDHEHRVRQRLRVFRAGAGVIPWTLLGFILLSACLHAFGFYVFQTVYPAAARIGPPPVQVALLSPGTPEADAILRWINSEDPALAAEPGNAPIPGLMSVPYIPSYATVHARPAMAPASEAPVPYPDGVSGLDLVQMAASSPRRFSAAAGVRGYNAEFLRPARCGCAGGAPLFQQPPRGSPG